MVYSWQGARTLEVGRIFREEFGSEADRIVVVLAGQIGASQRHWHPARYLLETPVYVAEEGGQHFIGSSFTRDVVNTHQGMYDLYRALFDVWKEEGGGLFVHFAGIIPRGVSPAGEEPGYFESENFGIKERQTQTPAEAPKWRAVLEVMREIGQLSRP